MLAAGLTLDGPTLTLSGTPTESGYFTPVFTYTDSGAQTLTTSASLFINGAGSNLSINSSSDLGAQTTGSSYSNQFFACCAGSITWSTIGGSLPPGLTLSAGGLLNGTPSASGTYTFLLQATDAGNAANYAARQFTLNVTPIAITSNFTLPFGNVGTGYSQTLMTTGGRAPSRGRSRPGVPSRQG